MMLNLALIRSYNMQQKIFINPTSCNFWWGVYGLTEQVTWEDINLYKQIPGGLDKFDSMCVCSRRYFDELLEDEEYMAGYEQKLIQFLQGDEITYDFTYDESCGDLPYEDVELNEMGKRPCYMEIWYPTDYLDINSVKKAAKEFCKKFWGLDNFDVVIKDETTKEEAEATYFEHVTSFSGDIVFSDDVINQMSNHLNKTREEVLRLLERSIKN
jgi:hypothetical protein